MLVSGTASQLKAGVVVLMFPTGAMGVGAAGSGGVVEMAKLIPVTSGIPAVSVIGVASFGLVVSSHHSFT